MNSCEKTILNLLSRALFGADKMLEQPVDWAKLYVEARAQTVLPLVYYALTEKEREQMPQEWKEKWKQAFFSAIVTNEQVLYAQNNLVELLNEHHIPFVILKGKGSAFNYPDPSLRLLGDIDLLVGGNHIEEVCKWLIQDGYQEKAEGDLHIAFHKNNIIVELHKKPISLSFNENETIEKEVEHFFADILEKRQEIDGVSVPAYLHQAIVLLMHKLEHFLNGELGLRQLCDWAVFVEKRLDAIQWEILAPILERFGIKTFTMVVTKVCIEYLGLPSSCAEWAIGCEDALVKDVIELIVESGNFGGKVENSYGQRLFVDAHSKNRFASFFKVLFTTCRTHWSPCAKCPLLLPIAPFVVYFKYLKMRKQGKRKKLQLTAVYKKAGSRQKLYQELKPFIREEKTKS